MTDDNTPVVETTETEEVVETPVVEAPEVEDEAKTDQSFSSNK